MNLFQNLPKEKMQKIVLVGIVTVAAVAGTLEFYVLCEWRAFFGSKAEIAQLTSQITDGQQQQRAATENQLLVKQLQQFVETQQAAMAQGDAFAWAVREISLLAEKHPVHVLSLRPGGTGQPAPSKEAATYATRLEVAGTYDQIGNFIKDLENHFPTAEIRALEIAGNASAPGTHQANLELAFLIRSEPPAGKAVKKVAS